MKVLFALRESRNGSAAVEFAIAAPILILLIIGVFQIAALFYASAGLKYGLDEASRLAIIYPRPTDSTIRARFTEKAFGIDKTRATITVTHSTSNGFDYADLKVNYTVPMNFVFFSVASVALEEKRRSHQTGVVSP